MIKRTGTSFVSGFATHVSVALLALAVLNGGCGGDDDDGAVIGDSGRGGLLYDSWWTVNGANEPEADHPLWATQSTNTRSGSTTWRCKECHGWDYQGADGAYGSGSSHFTGFPGVFAFASTASEQEIVDVLKGSTNPAHDFSGALSADDIDDLAGFLRRALVDMREFIDLDSGIASGDTTAGMALFEGRAQCSNAACHGIDGTAILFDDELTLGALANDNPWEVLHKIRWGQPGSVMPSAVQDNGLSDPEIGDVLAYAQTLPTEPQVGDSATRGGLLYDKWWTVNGANEPTTNHPLWATQSTNTRSGSTTWRCKECHGWDYQGAEGGYGPDSSHFTGFAGVLDFAEVASEQDLVDSLTGSGSAGVDHDFSDSLAAGDIEDLVNFMLDGLVDMTLFIDLASGASNGDVFNGQSLFEGRAGCGEAACHGVRGTRILFEDGEESLGGLSNDNPWEVLHKIRWGNPGSSMPSALRDNGLTDEDTNDVLAYAQTLPETWACGDGFLDGDEGCDDGNTIDGDGCAADCSVETLDGAALFETQCSTCHGADGSGAVGPDIRGASAVAIQSAIDEDKGGMGSLEMLEPDEIQAIATFL